MQRQQLTRRHKETPEKPGSSDASGGASAAGSSAGDSDGEFDATDGRDDDGGSKYKNIWLNDF